MNEVQRFECLVTEIADGTVYTNAIDVTAGDQMPEHFIEIPMDQFTAFERGTLRPGRIFEMVFFEDDNGTTSVCHEYAYHRWTQEEIDSAEEIAAALWDALH